LKTTGIETLKTFGVETLKAAAAIDPSGTTEAIGGDRRSDEGREKNRGDGNKSRPTKHWTILYDHPSKLNLPCARTDVKQDGMRPDAIATAAERRRLKKALARLTLDE